MKKIIVIVVFILIVWNLWTAIPFIALMKENSDQRLTITEHEKKIQDYEESFVREEERFQNCKDFSLFTQAKAQIGNRTYDINDYNCLNFSKDLVKELAEIGIKSSIAINKDRTHAWIVVWIEATTGRFIHPGTNLGILELRDKDMNPICK